MLSHDNLIWQAVNTDTLFVGDYLIGEEDRVVSYLPLSHIAGLHFDVVLHLAYAFKVYFARPDALQGSLT
jgi:long-chain-fatty-acid--CoA ligase ACSBG